MNKEKSAHVRHETNHAGVFRISTGTYIYSPERLGTLTSPNLPKLGLTLMTANQWITDGFYTISPVHLQSSFALVVFLFLIVYFYFNELHLDERKTNYISDLEEQGEVKCIT